MGKSKKGAKPRKPKLVSFVDLREVRLDIPVSKESQDLMVQQVISMEIPQFTDLVEKNGLICFGSATFADLFRIGPPYSPDCFVDVWCPSQLKEAGRHFTLEQHVFVDNASDAKYKQILLREKEVSKLQEDLILQESQTDIRGQGLRLSQEEKARKHESSQKSVFFKAVRGARSRSMAVPNFISMVEARDPICYNYAGYAMLYEDDDQAADPQEGSSDLHLFLPGRHWDEALESGIVYVERFAAQHSLLLEHLGEPEEQHVDQQEEDKEGRAEVEGSGNQIEEEEEAVAAMTGGASQEVATNLWEEISKKGYTATTKELCHAMNSELGSIRHAFTSFQQTLLQRLDRLEQRLGGRLERLEHQVENVQLSLSRTSERASRQSFWLFYEKFSGVVILPPITNKLLPYTAKASLENLAKLCSMPGLHGKDMKPNPIPKFADIDILLRVQGDQFQSHEVGHVGTTTVSEAIEGQRFDLIVVAEVTRSTALCASAPFFRLPKKLTNDPSSKLLYKFVQLERDILAAMAYYGIGLDRIGGAAIISPSFARLSEPNTLATHVLQGLGTELASLTVLYQRGCLWLFDM